MKRVWSILVLALLAAAVVGCGGGDEGTASTISKGKFLVQVDQLCTKREEEKFAKIAKAVKAMKPLIKNEQLSRSNLESLTRLAVLPVFKKMTGELRELEPPADSDSQFDAVVAKFEKDVAETEKDPGRFVDGLAFKDGNRAASAYGFKDCEF